MASKIIPKPTLKKAVFTYYQNKFFCHLSQNKGIIFFFCTSRLLYTSPSFSLETKDEKTFKANLIRSMFTFKIYNVNIWSKLNQITSGNFVWREQFTMFILYFLLSYIFPSISTKSSWDSSASASFGSTCTEKFQCDLKLLTTNKATARTSPPTISQQNLAYSYLKGTYECWQGIEGNRLIKKMLK